MNSYLLLSVLTFVIMLIVFFNSKHPKDKEAKFFTKIGVAIIVALIAPAIILGALAVLGLGIWGHGG